MQSDRAQINELFNFKQSFSTVLGAQFQLRQLDASNRSGNIIMYFTMMTILFVCQQPSVGSLYQIRLTDKFGGQSSLSLVTAFMALNVRTFPHDEGGAVEWGFTFASSRIGNQPPFHFRVDMNSVSLSSANFVSIQWHTPSPSPRRFGSWLCSSTRWEMYTTRSRISYRRSRGTTMSLETRLEGSRRSSYRNERQRHAIYKYVNPGRPVGWARVILESGE
jgi:hypothetical protein